jgi:2-haloacid dehalogenase
MSDYCSPSTGQVIRAVLFDTFGTVVDWRSGITRAVDEFGRRHQIALDSAAFAIDWRKRYKPAMAEVLAGRRDFASLDVLHRENLEASLCEFGVDSAALPEHDLAALAKSWRWLPPWPDSVDGIAAMKRHVIVGPLSNGNTGLLVDMAKYGGLPWDVVLGSDVSRSYKPDLRAYLTPVTLLDLEPGEVMLVAAHNLDLDAAQRAGMATGFVARPDEYGSEQTTDWSPSGSWDVSGRTLTELAGALFTGSDEVAGLTDEHQEAGIRPV